jgi:hypothetical protein
VESRVLIVERSILARLRHEISFILAALNLPTIELIGELNQRPFQERPGNRQSRFVGEERAHLRALPVKTCEFAPSTLTDLS